MAHVAATDLRQAGAVATYLAALADAHVEGARGAVLGPVGVGARRQTKQTEVHSVIVGFRTWVQRATSTVPIVVRWLHPEVVYARPRDENKQRLLRHVVQREA